MEVSEKWAEVFKDEALVKELCELGTVEEVQERLKEKGFSYSIEEIAEVGRSLRQAVSELNNGELNAEDLEAVAGGSVGKAVGVALIAVGCVGLAGAAAAATPAVFAAW